MKLEKTKNVIRNIVFGFLYRIVAILGPFAVRTVILYVLGTEYVGLNSLFTSILNFLSLAELGVGSALVYSMYKPIAEDDTATICSLLNLYKKLYRYIGCIILVIGLLLLPFLKYLVKDNVPEDVDLYILYLVYLGNTVVSYLMFAYKQSLLSAFQRSDIVSKRSLVVQFFMFLIQILVLIVGRNYYLYLIWLPIFTVITNIANAVIVDKMFPQYKCAGEVPKELKKSISKKVVALLGTKANSIVMHAADNIVVSAFLGLTMVGRYGNYYYIMNAVAGLMTIIYDSLTAGLGNSLEVDSDKIIYRHFRMLTFLNTWIAVFCSVSLLCLYQPFMEIWVKKENMLGLDIVILLVCYFYIYQVRRIILTYKDAGGIWWEDRFRPYVVMIVNVGSNLILINFIGLQGVILSTILSMVISVPWETYTVFKYIFHNKTPRPYYSTFLFNTLVCTCLCGITWMLCSMLPGGITGIVLRALICVIVPNSLFVLIHIKSEDLQMTMQFMKEKIRKIRLK